MSTSIRPPGGPAATGPTELEGLAETQSAEVSSASETSAAARIAAPQASEVQSPTAGVLSRLDAGEVTREQAIETLVAQALEVHGGARLPPAQRDELATVLRAALLDDPALSRMLGG